MSTDSQQPAGSHAWLVAFDWGALSTDNAAYTSWTDTVTVDPYGGLNPVTFRAVDPVTVQDVNTRLKVEPGNQTGTTKDEPWVVTMPRVTPLNLVARTTTFNQVNVRIWECDPTAEKIVPVLMWQGYIGGELDWDGPDLPSLIKFPVAGWKSRIAYPMGVESKTHCSRIFGDAWCGVAVSNYTTAAVITSVVGRVVTIPTLTVPPGKPSAYWTNGSVLVDGLAIKIYDGTAAGGYKLVQYPPPEWAGQTAVCSPGCDHLRDSPTGCTGWANRPRFFGLGGVKPTASPVIGPR